MVKEVNQAKRFLGLKFGYGEVLQDGVYAIPTDTSKGDAFMRLEIVKGDFGGTENFKLFWDEKLTVSWYVNEKPRISRESDFASLFRRIDKLI